MRILFLSNLFPPYIEGGSEILANDVATQLQALGHETLVLTSYYKLPGARVEQNTWRILKMFPPVYFDRRASILRRFQQIYHYYRNYHSSSNARALRRIIARTRPDVVYIWEISGVGITSLMKALARLDTPIVFQMGSYWLLYARNPETEQSRLRASRLKQRLIGSFPYPKTATMIAVSKTVKQQHVEAGYDAGRIEVIYNGIDARFLELPATLHTPAESDAGTPIQLLYVGRVRIEKGILVIFKALDLLLNMLERTDNAEFPYHLRVIGSGDKLYLDELQAFLREKDLSRAVTFHGKMPQEELITYYDRSHIMLVPSLWQEPFGLVVAEAMARQLPVIASNVGGPAEILTHESNGLLVKAGDEHELAGAIRLLAERPDLRARLGQAARETVRTHFTIEENARRIEKHLAQTIMHYNTTLHGGNIEL